MNGKRMSFYERVIYPLYRIKNGPTYGYKTINLFKQLNNTQWLSRDELISYQEIKLRKLIQHVYHNVPYYREIMDEAGLIPEDIRHIEDLKHFPILTKKEINESSGKIISNRINKRSVIKATTSGTTGVPLTFYRDMNTCIWTDAALLRGMSWANYRVGGKIVSFSDLNWPSLLGKLRLRLIYSYSFPAFAKEEDLLGYMTEIKRLQPSFMKGMASNLYRIATLWRKHDITGIHIPVIFSTAEMLYDFQRAFLENYFKSRVFDYYGCNEIGSLAYECECKQKHISDEHVIIETTDSKGNNVQERAAEITITDLDNYAMPFIRYKNGDVGVLSDQPCGCKRHLKLLKRIEGRSQDFLKTLDGNVIPSIFFPGHFRNIKGIEQYQIVQPDLYHITLKFVKNQFFSEKELNDMLQMIKEMIGHNVNINLEECSYIPLTGRGKSRLVISNVPTRF